MKKLSTSTTLIKRNKPCNVKMPTFSQYPINKDWYKSAHGIEQRLPQMQIHAIYMYIIVQLIKRPFYLPLTRRQVPLEWVRVSASVSRNGGKNRQSLLSFASRDTFVATNPRSKCTFVGKTGGITHRPSMYYISTLSKLAHEALLLFINSWSEGYLRASFRVCPFLYVSSQMTCKPCSTVQLFNCHCPVICDLIDFVQCALDALEAFNCAHTGGKSKYYLHTYVNTWDLCARVCGILLYLVTLACAATS